MIRWYVKANGEKVLQMPTPDGAWRDVPTEVERGREPKPCEHKITTGDNNAYRFAWEYLEICPMCGLEFKKPEPRKPREAWLMQLPQGELGIFAEKRDGAVLYREVIDCEHVWMQDYPVVECAKCGVPKVIEVCEHDMKALTIGLTGGFITCLGDRLGSILKAEHHNPGTVKWLYFSLCMKCGMAGDKT